MRDNFGATQIKLPDTLPTSNKFSQETNFVKIMDALGLNPETDFQYSDLSGVDFSDCDLRGFNFTGSDLSNSFGRNIIYDATTKIEAADVKHSPFSLASIRLKLSIKKSKNDMLYQEFMQSYMSDRKYKVIDKLISRKNAVKREVLQKFYLYSEDKKTKGEMLRLLSTLDAGCDDDLGLILSACATQTDRNILIPAVRSLSANFRNQIVSFNTFLSLLKSKDEGVRIAAIQGLVRSEYFSQEIELIANAVRSDKSPWVRRSFFIGAARLLKAYGRPISRCESFIDELSLDTPITDEILSLAHGIIAGGDYYKIKEVKEAVQSFINLLISLNFYVRMDLKKPLPRNAGFIAPTIHPVDIDLLINRRR